jgi:hypothetical protein
MKKLITPAMYGQRQAPWASDLLGYNTSSPYTIGNYGCLITCLGMYVGKNPREVNELLKANNGYVSGGNFVWSKCSVLGLKELYTSPYYDGPVSTQGLTKIKETIDQGYPLLCEVDFNANTVQTEMHFVLIVGYEGDLIYANDPWTGLFIELGVYGGAKRAIIQFKQYDKKLPFEGNTCETQLADIQVELNICRQDRDNNHNDRMALYEELGFTGAFNRVVAVERIKMLMSIENQVKLKDEQLKTAQETITKLQNITDIQESKLVTLQQDIEKLQERVTFAVEDNKRLQDALEKAQKETQAPVYVGYKKWIYETFLR